MISNTVSPVSGQLVKQKLSVKAFVILDRITHLLYSLKEGPDHAIIA